MAKDEQTPDPARRSLLKAAPLEEPAKPKGYHETEHIRRYYATAAYW